MYRILFLVGWIVYFLEARPLQQQQQSRTNMVKLKWRTDFWRFNPWSHRSQPPKVPFLLLPSLRGGAVGDSESPAFAEDQATFKNDLIVLEEASQLIVSNNNTSNTSSPVASWRTAFPEPLRRKGSKTFQKLKLGTVDIYLLGTAHVSNDSSAETRLLLHAVQPDCIFVELCDARMGLLLGMEEDSPSRDETSSQHGNNTTHDKDTSFWRRVQSTRQAQGGGRMQALSTVLLTSVQEQYAKELGVELGGEFHSAHQYWKETRQRIGMTIQKPHLVLGDRPMAVTLIRAWESLTRWGKVKIMIGLIWSSLFPPDKEEIRKWIDSIMNEETDILTESFQDLRKHFPTLYLTIIEERDAWLAAKLVQTCRALSSSIVRYQQHEQAPRRPCVVAIVGAGHVPGICRYLTSPSITNQQSPEGILANLVTTKRWANDPIVQKEMIPSWVHDVSELND